MKIRNLTGSLALALVSSVLALAQQPNEPQAPKPTSALNSVPQWITPHSAPPILSLEPDSVPHDRPLEVVTEPPGALPPIGPNHKLVQTIAQSNNEKGETVLTTNSYWHLEPGIHFVDKNGKLQESQAIFEIKDGFAVADRMQHKVRLAGNILTVGSVELTLPDGQRLVSHVSGLRYFDSATGKAVLVSEVKESQAYVVGDNQVVYADAFESINADVRYSISTTGMAQDILLHEAPPSPETFGLDPTTTRLEVLTEIVSGPKIQLYHDERELTSRSLSPIDQPSRLQAEDQTLDLGTMKIGAGRAFRSDTERGPGVPVSKRWLEGDGRSFLIEAIESKTADQLLKGLRKGDGASLRVRNPATWVPRASAQVLPNSRRTSSIVAKNAAKNPPASVLASLVSPMVVLDYDSSLSGGSFTNITFKGDATYLVSGVCNLIGTCILEGGAVFKYPPYCWTNGQPYTALIVKGRLMCNTSPYRPAIFLPWTNTLIGAAISSPTNSPSGTYGTLCIQMDSGSSSADLHDLRFSQMSEGLSLWNAVTNRVRNIQCTGSNNDWTWAVDMGSGSHYIGNVLVTGTTYPFQVRSNGTLTLEHATVDKCGVLLENSYGGCAAVTIRNCVITPLIRPGLDHSAPFTFGTNTYQYSYGNGGGTNWPASATGLFASSMGGNYYLSATSTLRGAGSTNIDNVLAVDFANTFTTTTPTKVTGAIPGGSALGALVPRNLGNPDIGYHYPAIDYEVSEVTVGNGPVLVTNGVVLGWYGKSAFVIQNAEWLVVSGLPQRPNRIINYRLVQESMMPVENPGAGTFRISGPGRVSMRFSTISTLGWGTGSPYRALFDAASADKPLTSLFIRDCQLEGMEMSYYPLGITGITVDLINNVFNRAKITLFKTIYNGSVSTPLTINARNNLFYNAPLSLVYDAGGPNPTWNFTDNVFDNVAPAVSGTQTSSINGNNNGFINLPISAVFPGSINNQFLSSMDYEVGVLGQWYQLTNAFAGKGSWSATNVGLQQFTVRADQTTQGVGSVDLGFHYVATTGLVPTVNSVQGVGSWYYQTCPTVDDVPTQMMPTYITFTSGGTTYTDWVGASSPSDNNYYAQIIGGPTLSWMSTGVSFDPAIVYQSSESRYIFARAIVSDAYTVHNNPAADGVSISMKVDGVNLRPPLNLALLAVNQQFNVSAAVPVGHSIAAITGRKANEGEDTTAWNLKLFIDTPRDADQNGLPDYLDTETYDFDAGLVAQLLSQGLNPYDPANRFPQRLAHWRFDTNSNATEEGCVPTVNLAPSCDSFDGMAVSFANTSHSLVYPVTWALSGQFKTNMTFWNGAIRFTYVPSWYSSISSSPNAWCRLVECGNWAISVTPDGSGLSFQSVAGSGSVRTNIVAPLPKWGNYPPGKIGWEITVSYTPWSSSIQIGEGTTNKYLYVSSLGVDADLPATVKAGGIRIGSSSGGAYNAQGFIDELEAFNCTISPTPTADPDVLSDLTLYQLWSNEYRHSQVLTATDVGTGIKLKWVRGWEGDWSTNNLSSSPYTIYRRTAGLSSWSGAMSWPDIRQSEWVDTTAVPGAYYEYKIGRGSLVADKDCPTIAAAIKGSPVDVRGTAIVLVDSTLATALTTELASFSRDLTADGWNVILTNVPRHVDLAYPNHSSADDAVYISQSAPTNALNASYIKSYISNIYTAHITETNVVFLIGHVAIPYSGFTNNIDGHIDHNGAFPADSWYGDMTGTWSDTNTITASNIINSNISNDGRWDQDYLPLEGSDPGRLEVAIGRVDFAIMPAYQLNDEATLNQTEVRLLKQYFGKIGRFRRAQIPYQSDFVAWIADYQFYGLIPTSQRIQSRVWGGELNDVSRYATDLFWESNNHLWGVHGDLGAFRAFGNNQGLKREHAAVAVALEGYGNSPHGMFQLHFGSYINEWFHWENDPLRVALGVSNAVVSVSWLNVKQGTVWKADRMHLGGHNGLALQDTFAANSQVSCRTTAILGDPFLREFPMPQVATLSAATVGSNIVLGWSTSVAATSGYRIFRSNSTNTSAWVRIADVGNGSTSWTDLAPLSGRNAYLIKGLSLFANGSGSFTNTSIGTPSSSEVVMP